MDGRSCRVVSLLIMAIVIIGVIFESAEFGRYLRVETYANRSLETTICKNKSDPKLILFWPNYFQSARWPYPEDAFRRCPQSNCKMTHDRSLADQADMIVFHCRGQSGLKKYGWPKKRLPGQKYVLACFESPVHTNLRPYSGRINFTSTYRWDSDVLVGRSFRRKKLVTSGPYALKNPLSKRTKNIVWMVSNCNAQPRKNYVKELSKYIDVDIYGGCGRLTCKHGEACFDQFEKTYKFYLSFENSVCLDYVTEKLQNALSVELIPVVLGAGNYSRNAPPDSVIDVRDFPSAKALAEFLHSLGQNERLFASYFQWKKEYELTLRNAVYDRPCAYCEAVNKDGIYRDAATFDLVEWWNPPGVCSAKDIHI